MRAFFMFGLTAFLIAILASPGLAQPITVQVVGDGSFSPSFPTSGDNITLTANGTGTVLFRVFGDPSNTDIGTLTVTGSNTGRVDILIEDNSAFPAFPIVSLLDASARNWAGLVLDPNATNLQGRVRLAASIAGELIGDVIVPQVYVLEVSGSVAGLVRATADAPVVAGDGAVFDTMVVDNDVSGQGIEATGNGAVINRITIGGTCDADILAPNGSIGAIECLSVIGPINEVSIFAKDGIGTIFAENAIRAHIRANGNGGTGSLDAMYCAGFLQGSVRAFHLLGTPGFPTGGISMQGDIGASLDFDGSVASLIGTSGNFLPGSNITVAGDLLAGIEAVGSIQDIDVQGDWVPDIQAGAIVIRSNTGSIGNIRIGGEAYNPSFRPRIAAAGSIASIRIEGTDRIDINRVGADPYLDIGTLHLFYHIQGNLRVGEFDSIIIDQDLRGPLWLRRVPPGSTVLVGNSCYDPCNIANPDGLQGQVIINHAANNPPPGFIGQWTVGTSNPISLLPDPHYSTPSSSLGGGAVGRVPYRLYDTDCDPPHHDDWDVQPGEPHILNSQFSHDPAIPSASHESVKIRFYGPVRTNAIEGTDPPPVRLWLWLNNLQWADVTEYVTITMKRGSAPGLSREIEVAGNGGALLAPGFYAIVVITTPGFAERVYCDATLASFPPSLLPNIGEVIQYNFFLFPDCDLDNCEDFTPCDPSPTCIGVCVADVDNGTFTGQPDGGVTIDDLTYYLAIYAEGFPEADVDDGSATGTPDGGVTIDDLLYYLIRFEAGC